MAGDDRVGLLRELERADEAVAAELGGLDELQAAVDELRERAVELRDFLARLPDERAEAAAAIDAGGRGVAEARAAAEEAAAELAAAEAGGDEERIAAARRFEVRARDHRHVSERKAAAARDRAAALEARAEAAEREVTELEARARGLAETLRRTPRLSDEAPEPGSGPEGVADWGTQARAALLVTRGQLAGERDAVVRQAVELGGLLLGEPLPPTSASAVARRVERELRSD